MNKFIAVAICLVAICAVAFYSKSKPKSPAKPIRYSVRVVKRLEHDRRAFTQGLVFHNGRLFESTGQYGESDIRELNPDTGEVLRVQDIDDSYFAEGIAVVDQSLVMLTWRSQTAMTFEIDSFEIAGERTFPGEGWGLTFDGEHLISSDGSAILKVLDPDTFDVVRRIEVKHGREQVQNLNELEFYKGELLANIWHSTRIARISLDDGRVTGWIELSEIIPPEVRGDLEAVANGIAWHPQDNRLLVTGKNWPAIFEVELIPSER